MLQLMMLLAAPLLLSQSSTAQADLEDSGCAMHRLGVVSDSVTVRPGRQAIYSGGVKIEVGSTMLLADEIAFDIPVGRDIKDEPSVTDGGSIETCDVQEISIHADTISLQPSGIQVFQDNVVVRIGAITFRANELTVRSRAPVEQAYRN